jgi:hypothetical protein
VYILQRLFAGVANLLNKYEGVVSRVPQTLTDEQVHAFGCTLLINGLQEMIRNGPLYRFSWNNEKKRVKIFTDNGRTDLESVEEEMEID